MARSSEIRSFLLKEIPRHSQDVVTFAAMKFNVARMTIYRHLQKLVKQNQVVQTGEKRGVEYFLNTALERVLRFKIASGLEEADVWSQYFKTPFQKLPKNILDICEYGFTEMFNNAKEHSEGTDIIVEKSWSKHHMMINLLDNGVGVFQKLQRAFHFQDMREGMLALSKGKLTTDPNNHTGEGIFFTSRIFDVFQLSANGLCYLRDNVENDFSISEDKISCGTRVYMKIARDSRRDLVEIFKNFQGGEENLSFTKTEVLVKLSQFGEDRFVSRSQAKRIVRGLEKFEHVKFDFRDVEMVGQGFVDEVFRVFQNKYPKIKIEYVNAVGNVEFMVKRGIDTGKG
ncbi:MAG: hypothetical protein A3C55_04280 [Gammaproteobacteria bacterium RIFCSPHIGHO2_02_FULL_42_13]|nr:MAG: hypothetical protein A3C55_04280 [Gammaproteobacteria bacterium RIFCSPHIGHO2_02_FULL_42_13]OGT69657.1 MAG: hypothetical protein A3H43_05235 [Gammaproteobacteria bacterium RIFCSPLOWO2_02_FULL_42_9]